MSVNSEEEIERLEAEASAAGIEASSLESRLQDIPRIVDNLQHQLNEAKQRREIALTKLRKLKPIKLPPIPTMDQMLEMARRQCPDRDAAVIKRLVGQMHAG